MQWHDVTRKILGGSAPPWDPPSSAPVSSYKIIVVVIYRTLLSLMPIEETRETRVRTDCLNFDVSLCVQIKNKFHLKKEGIENIFYWILDPAAVKDCTKFLV